MVIFNSYVKLPEGICLVWVMSNVRNASLYPVTNDPGKPHKKAKNTSLGFIWASTGR